MTKKNNVELDEVVVRFAGDSGDGMQLTGVQFSDTAAIAGNDISTFPDFPAEIRAPQGTVAGVSGFQVHLGHVRIHTPGDSAEVLVAMNPAAIKSDLHWVKKGGTIIVDVDNFNQRNFDKAQLETNPLEDGSLDAYNVVEAPLTSLTKEALSDSGLDTKSVTRSKNMFALGIVYWLFNRKLDVTLNFLDKKFKKNDVIREANKKVLHAGFAYGETIEALPSSYTVLPAKMGKGRYRNINGNTALAWGFLAASEKSKRELFLGSYPITPASDILHELANHKGMGVKVFQAEDEIAAVCSAIGASFAGDLGITTTSGPGFALKGEAIGLAVMTELPLVVVNVQRAGPSTGMPTKTEQSDLLQAIHGRNGECPAVVIAPSTPGNCFYYSYYASKIAMEHMTPVVLLSDGYLANGAEPWKFPSVAELPEINPPIANKKKDKFMPYARGKETLAREWALPGTKDLEHRIGGIEKADITGNVSYDPENHEKMVKIREEKVRRVANFIPELELEGSNEGDILVVGWGGTHGTLLTLLSQMSEEGTKISLAHFNFIYPLPKNTADVFSKFKKIVVCELNNGQFVRYLRAELPQFEYLQYNKIQGLPFMVSELVKEFKKLI